LPRPLRRHSISWRIILSKIGEWFKRRFKELELLEEYFPVLFTRWQAAIWGGSVLAVAFGWRFITSDWPYPVKLTACVVGLFFAGYYVWRADHLRLEKKIAITRVFPRNWTIPQGSVRAGHHARAYCIELINKSEGITVEGVSVQLKSMFPEVPDVDFLPINLHLQHDNPTKAEDQARSFDLNPCEPKNVDFVSAFEGDNVFSIVHVVAGVNHTVHFDTEGHRLQVMVTAKHMPMSLIWFKVWRDEAGLMQCEIEQNEKSRTTV
jgi:hypothetical protein